jgi:hypothetical protein
VSAFIPGLRLAELFYREAVGPILARHYPNLAYSAALIGYGSDVLGFDTARSMDHEWGPRLQLFLTDADAPRLGPEIHELLRQDLPSEVAGISTHFAEGDEAGIRHLRQHTGGPVEHKVTIHTVLGFLRDRYGLPGYRALTPADWLTATDQTLLELTKGAIYHDGLDELRPMQAALAYYPDQVWRYRLAAQWARIGEMEAFVGRTAEVGDEIGSRLTAALLVRDVMRLAFLMERQYAPYAKWFGTGFTRLACAPELGQHLERALAAESFVEREGGLAEAYRVVARMHNALALTPPMRAEPVGYFGRPFLVIFAGEFAAAIKATITDPAVLALPNEAGGIDQFSDSTVVLGHHRHRLRAFYSG